MMGFELVELLSRIAPGLILVVIGVAIFKMREQMERVREEYQARLEFERSRSERLDRLQEFSQHSITRTIVESKERRREQRSGMAGGTGNGWAVTVLAEGKVAGELQRPRHSDNLRDELRAPSPYVPAKPAASSFQSTDFWLASLDPVLPLIRVEPRRATPGQQTSWISYYLAPLALFPAERDMLDPILQRMAQEAFDRHHRENAPGLIEERQRQKECFVCGTKGVHSHRMPTTKGIVRPCRHSDIADAVRCLNCLKPPSEDDGVWRVAFEWYRGAECGYCPAQVPHGHRATDEAMVARSGIFQRMQARRAVQ